MLETATKFILDFILDNEEVKKFPKDFVTASMKWVRSWFLTDDDPDTKSMLESNASIEKKKEAIVQKTERLQQNPQFNHELKERLQEYGIHVANSRNVAIGNTISAHTVHIGDVVYGTPLAAPNVHAAGNLSQLEKQGMEDRLQLLLRQRQAIQKGHDLEGDAGRRFAYEQQLAEKNTQITELKQQLGL